MERDVRFVTDQEIVLVVKGSKGACTMTCFLGVSRIKLNGLMTFNYHSRKPKYDFSVRTDYPCQFLEDGSHCYCDGRGLSRESTSHRAIIDAFYGGDSSLVWEFLEDEYGFLKE